MLILLLSAFAASAAPSSTILRYEKGTARYAIEKSASDVVMYGAEVPMRIAIKPCSQEAVKDLWRDIETNYKFLPELSKRSTVSQSKDGVTLGGKKRALLPLNVRTRSATEYFRYMERTFFYAKMKIDDQCR